MLSAIALAALASCALSGCDRADAQPRTRPRAVETASVDGGAARVQIHLPDSLTSIESTTTDLAGRPQRILCGTCHELPGQQFPLPASEARLGGPHAGLRFEHGTNRCASCHDPEHYDRLRLATGESIPMVDALQLCAQCHGPQYRDYSHGAHGGMTGYWDLSRGPRVRNHCVDCHDPHRPRYPTFRPMPPPRDAPPRTEADHG